MREVRRKDVGMEGGSSVGTRRASNVWWVSARREGEQRESRLDANTPVSLLPPLYSIYLTGRMGVLFARALSDDQ